MKYASLRHFYSLLFLSSVISVACADAVKVDDESKAILTSVSMTQAMPSSQQPSNAGTQVVTIKDQSLNLPMARITIPAGWKLRQDVASNPQAGGFYKFNIEILSPEGGMYIVLPTNTSYYQIQDGWTGQVTGHGFVEVAMYMARMTLRDKSTSLQVSELKISEKAKLTPEYQKHKQMIGQMGYDYEVFKASIDGSMHGQAWKGEAGFAVLDYSRQMGGQMRGGVILYGAVQIAPAAQYAQFEAQCKIIKYETDKQWDAIQVNRIKQQTQQMNRSHQSRMASNQAAFNATQQAYRETQDAYQASNDSWYQQNLGAGSDYNSTAAFNDAMTGHSTFNDSYSGHQTRQEGHYDYWYSNGLGEYYGTDDPSFNPASMQGDWQRVEPMSPTNH